MADPRDDYAAAQKRYDTAKAEYARVTKPVCDAGLWLKSPETVRVSLPRVAGSTQQFSPEVNVIEADHWPDATRLRECLDELLGAQRLLQTLYFNLSPEHKKMAQPPHF